MDYNEIGKGMVNRHPWELSRTGVIIREWKKYLDELHKNSAGALKYINIGAGDMYFDEALLDLYKDDILYAADLGYDTQGQNVLEKEGRFLTHSLSDIDDNILFDYAIMMDSLEYFPDDEGMVRDLVARVKSGGYLFFTLPAYTKLFSDHDIHVGNLKRYDRKAAEKMFAGIDDIELVYSRHFYFSLYLVRLFQVLTKAKIDPDQKVTTGWKHRETSLMTGLVKGVLNLDYALGRHFPGLSLMMVCKRK